MQSIEMLKLHKQVRFSGTFRLRDADFRETKDGRIFLKFYMEDSTGELPSFIWEKDLDPGLCFPDYTLVQVEGTTRILNGHLLANVRRIALAKEKRAGEVLRLIPQSLSPITGLLAELEFVFRQISIPVLKNFVEGVFADDGIAFPFISVPASLYHHHNYPGGLLLHSLQSIQMLERYRECSREEYELGIVAMLFHDIGKIQTLTNKMTCTSLGRWIDHDKITLEVLSPFLRKLEQQWEQGAQQLRYMLTWKISKPVPKYDMADVVACCDRLSAGLDLKISNRKPHLAALPAKYPVAAGNVTVALPQERYWSKRRTA
ncbi:MAG: hypothetical protein R6V21_13735 [Pelovirga sp.]